jgi:DNA-binding MarR family transcriptional regulator
MRVTRLSLTAAGQRLFARIWPLVERLNQAAIAGLPPGAADKLRETLARIKRNLDEEPAAPQRAA